MSMALANYKRHAPARRPDERGGDEFEGPDASLRVRIGRRHESPRRRGPEQRGDEDEEEREHALRHEPWLYELELDEEGWVALSDLVSSLQKQGKDWSHLAEDDIIKALALQSPWSRSLRVRPESVV